ncbi:3-dehydroquinate synthase [Rhodotorula toruloides]|nr:3-dehydroquinate synthase [Rhodotorula toruloides]
MASATVARPGDERNSLAIYGYPVAQSVSPKIFNHLFPLLGLPRHTYGAVECRSLDEPGNAWEEAIKRADCLGTCLTMPLKLQALRKVDELTPEARATGCVNTTFFRPSPTSSSTLVHVGTNTDAAAVSNVLLSSFLGVSSPLLASAPRQFQPGNAGAFVVGGGGATRAAIYALSRLNLSPIFIVNRDPSETERVVQSFPDIDLRPLTTIEQARREMEDLRKRGVRLVCGVSAIPCEPPTSEGEKRVYEVANEVFALAGGKGPEMERMERHEGCLPLPMKPAFVDMVYKPPMTTLRILAEERGWTTVCGTEVVLENCFEQCKLWTGIDVPSEVRDSARALLAE